MEKFISKVKELNLRNSIFVDITANGEVSKKYEEYLKQNIAVVTCNKIACSSAYDNYKKACFIIKQAFFINNTRQSNHINLNQL